MTSTRFDNVEILELIPKINSRFIEDGDGITVLLPRFTGRFLGKILQPRLPENRAWIKVKLDGRGVIIWNAIIKDLTVKGIIQEFIDNNSSDNQQASDRVWQYLLHLERNEMIVLLEKDS
jgi:hypothetical protein